MLSLLLLRTVILNLPLLIVVMLNLLHNKNSNIEFIITNYSNVEFTSNKNSYIEFTITNYSNV